ncbi:MAG: hypothetical protein UZ17_ACD001002814 [Acidobacteria bacterium OLB17]|nr:MAG: hypothetical protein UZ17_ACD001002814 [Acidobacteria bacterium OLB17]
MASTATQARPRTTIVCPRSRRAISPATKKAVFDVRKLFFGRLSTRHHAGGSKVILYEECRIDELDAFFCEFVGNAADKCVGIPSRKAPKHLHHSHVRDRSREYLNVLDLSGHYHFRYAAALEVRDHLAELADADPFEGAREVRKCRIGLFFYCDNRKLDTALSGAFDDEEREPAVAGNESVIHYLRSRYSGTRA